MIARSRGLLALVLCLAALPAARAQSNKPLHKTLVVIAPGWSQGDGRKEESWMDPMAKKIEQKLSAYGSDVETLKVNWPSHGSNKVGTDYVAKQIREKLKANPDATDVLFVGHSRGGVFVGDVMKKLGEKKADQGGKLGYVQMVMLDPTAARVQVGSKVLGDEYPRTTPPGVDKLIRYDDDRKFFMSPKGVGGADKRLQNTQDGIDIPGAENRHVGGDLNRIYGIKTDGHVTESRDSHVAIADWWYDGSALRGSPVSSRLDQDLFAFIQEKNRKVGNSPPPADTPTPTPAGNHTGSVGRRTVKTPRQPDEAVTGRPYQTVVDRPFFKEIPDKAGAAGGAAAKGLGDVLREGAKGGKDVIREGKNLPGHLKTATGTKGRERLRQNLAGGLNQGGTNLGGGIKSVGHQTGGSFKTGGAITGEAIANGGAGIHDTLAELARVGRKGIPGVAAGAGEVAGRVGTGVGGILIAGSKLVHEKNTQAGLNRLGQHTIAGGERTRQNIVASGQAAGKQVGGGLERLGQHALAGGDRLGDHVATGGDKLGQHVAAGADRLGQHVAAGGAGLANVVTGKSKVNPAAIKQAGKKAGKDISDTGKKAGKDVSDTWHKAGKDVSNTTKKAGKDFSETAKKAGKDFSNAGKKAGKDISDTGKKAGKDVSDTWHKAGKDISNTGKKALGDFASGAKSFFGLGLTDAAPVRETKSAPVKLKAPVDGQPPPRPTQAAAGAPRPPRPGGAAQHPAPPVAAGGVRPPPAPVPSGGFGQRPVAPQLPGLDQPFGRPPSGPPPGVGFAAGGGRPGGFAGGMHAGGGGAPSHRRH